MMARFLTGIAIVICMAALPATASTYTFVAALSGAQEYVPNASPGTGTATVLWDTDLETMMVSVVFAGLLSPTTAAHIHAATAAPFTGTAGVATQVPIFGGFPLGVTSGSYSSTFDLTSATTFNPSFIAANGGTADLAAAALLAALMAGEAYANIHTSEYPGGEIRGFFVPSVPLPAGLPLLAAAIVALAAARRPRR